VGVLFLREGENENVEVGVEVEAASPPLIELNKRRDAASTSTSRDVKQRAVTDP